ncbi:MAG: trypsin-like peptidase domain-containing protein [Deltaproteobacteria bacterium]|nr:trypsin-like peptidase domain-containing protein [Deltaproteobacteria bacterium]
MRRWVITIVLAALAVVIASAALWFSVRPREKAPAGGATARTSVDAGRAAAETRDGSAAAPMATGPQCTGRYADSFDRLSDRNREYERSPLSSYSYCVRNTATYEQVFYDPEGKIQKRHLKSVFHGTGFVFRESNGEFYVLTNEHVASQPEVTDESSKVDGIPFGSKKVSETVKIVKNEDDDFEKNHIVLTPVATDPLLDAAVLKTTARLNACPYKIGVSGELRVGNAVMVKGFPLGIFDVSASGKITNVRIDDTDGEWSHADFVVDAQLNTGQSGSPIMAVNCETGELEIVGLFHAYYSAGKGLNLGVHVDEIGDLLSGMKPKKRERKASGGFASPEDQLKVVKYLLDRKNLGIFRYGTYSVGAEVQKDRTVQVHLYGDGFPSNPNPRVTFIDTWRRKYGDLDHVALSRRSGRQLQKAIADVPEEMRRNLSRLYTDLWQQILKTILYRDLLGYSQESEDLYKRTLIRYNDLEGARKAQTEQVEAVLYEVDKLLQEEGR